MVDEDSCPCCRTAIAIGRDGAVYVAWRKIFSGGIRDVAVARADDGAAGFGTAHAIHADRWEFSACPHAGPSLAIDARDRLHAAWYNGAEGRQGLWYSTSTDGGVSFTPPTAILTDDWVPPSQARIATDGEGIIVAWDDFRETRRQVRLANMVDDHFAEPAVAFNGKAPAINTSSGLGALAWLDGEAVRVVTFASGER